MMIWNRRWRTFGAAVLMAGFVAAAPATRAQEAIRSAAAASEPGTATVDLGQLFDRIVETVQAHFFDDAMLQRIGWQALAAEARPDIVKAGSLAAAAPRINALLAELKTSHTAFYTEDDAEYYILLDVVGGVGTGDLFKSRYWGIGPHYASIGAFTAQLGQRHFVDAVLEGSPADRAGLKFGDEIVEVDGEAYSPVAAFRGKAGKSATLRVRRHAEAALDTLSVAVTNIVPKKAFADATVASARVFERGGKRIGYVHLWASTDAEALRRAMSAIEPALSSGRRGTGAMPTSGTPALGALIVDARGKVGGLASVPAEYLELLDPPGSRVEMRVVKSRSSQGGARPTLTFRGRTALLIDHKTRSAAEIFAHSFKRAKFGPVFGSNTAGAVTAGRGFMMPGDSYLYLAITGLEISGEQLEGRGVAPDIRVERPLPYANGADPVLDAALAALSAQPAAAPVPTGQARPVPPSPQ